MSEKLNWGWKAAFICGSMSVISGIIGCIAGVTVGSDALGNMGMTGGVLGVVSMCMFAGIGSMMDTESSVRSQSHKRAAQFNEKEISRRYQPTYSVSNDFATIARKGIDINTAKKNAMILGKYSNHAWKYRHYNSLTHLGKTVEKPADMTDTEWTAWKEDFLRWSSKVDLYAKRENILRDDSYLKCLLKGAFNIKDRIVNGPDDEEVLEDLQKIAKVLDDKRRDINLLVKERDGLVNRWKESPKAIKILKNCSMPS